MPAEFAGEAIIHRAAGVPYRSGRGSVPAAPSPLPEERALHACRVGPGGTVRLLRMLTGALLLNYPIAARAQTVWEMSTEYPQTAMPGLGVTLFAQHVAELSAGKLLILPSFDA